MIKTVKRVLGTSVLVQLMGIAIYPILMKFYSVEDLSVYGLLYGGMTIIAIVFSFRIENLFFNIDIKEAINLYFFYMRLIFFPLLVVFGGACYYFWGANDWLHRALLIGLAGCFFAGFNVVYNILVRLANEQYNLLKIVRAILELFAVGLAVSLSFNIEELFFCVSFTYFLVLIIPIVFMKNWKVELSINLSNFRFLFLDMVSSFINNVYLYSPNYFLYFGGNVKVSGYYFIITRVFGMPSLMVAQSLSTTLKQYLVGKPSAEYRELLKVFSNSIFKKIYYLYSGFCILSILVFLLIDHYIYDKIIYVFLLMLPLLVLRFKFLVYSGLFYVLKAYRENFYLQISLLIGVFIAVISGWLCNNSWVSLALYTMFTIIVYLFFLKLILEKNP